MNGISPQLQNQITQFQQVQQQLQAVSTQKVQMDAQRRELVRTKEELDKCSTCDMCAVVNNGLSEASMEQLKNKTGEEIVDADIAAQMKQ